MATTGSPDGRPEPQADGADTTREEPAAQTGQSEADRPRESYASIVAETLGLAPGSSRRRRAVTFLVTLAIALVAVFRDTLIGYVMIGPSVTRENESTAEYDANKAPFTVSMRPAESGDSWSWAVVLDRPLTPKEKRRLVADENPAAAFRYLRELGGRPLEHAAALEYAPERYIEQLQLVGDSHFVDVFYMNLMSTRSSTVVINGWKVTDISCRKTTAQTLVELPPQGDASYTGLQLHIPPLAGEPVLADNTEGQGEPYFGAHYIEVGGGQSSAGFKVQAIAPPGQACDWGIKVRYTDAYQKTRWVQLDDSEGKPLRIHTESAPVDAQQAYFLHPLPVRLCDQEDVSKCIT